MEPSGLSQPLAMYWFAYLWKKVMGQSTAVYPVATNNPTVLAAARGRAVALLNLAHHTETIAVGNATRCKVYALAPVTGPGGGPDGNGALVNGEALRAGDDGALPGIQPVGQPCHSVPLPGMSFAFVQTAA